MRDGKTKNERNIFKPKRKTESDESGYGESHTIDYSFLPKGSAEGVQPVIVQLESDDYSECNTLMDTIRKQTMENVKRTKKHIKYLNKDSIILSPERSSKSFDQSNQFDQASYCSNYFQNEEERLNNTSRTQYDNPHTIPILSDKDTLHGLKYTRSIGVETYDNGRIPKNSATQTLKHKQLAYNCKDGKPVQHQQHDQIDESNQKRSAGLPHKEGVKSKDPNRKNLMKLMLSQVKDLKSQIEPYLNEKDQTTLVASSQNKKIQEKSTLKVKASALQEIQRDSRRRLPNLPSDIFSRRRLPNVPFQCQSSAFKPVVLPSQHCQQLPAAYIVIASPARDECDDVCNSLSSSSFSCSSF